MLHRLIDWPTDWLVFGSVHLFIRFLFSRNNSEEDSFYLFKISTELFIISSPSFQVDTQRLIRILIAKTFYMLDDLNDCLIALDKCELNSIDLIQETNRRNLKIIAEAFCLKGWCLSKMSLANAKLKSAERSEKLMTDFEVSNDISLRCANISDTAFKDSTGSTELPAFFLSALLEDGLWKCPTLLAKHGWLSQSLVRFRDTLRAVETPATRRVRVKLIRQLVEFLLRCHLGTHYVDPRWVVHVLVTFIAWSIACSISHLFI